MLCALSEAFELPASARVSADHLSAHRGSVWRGEECVSFEQQQSTHLNEGWGVLFRCLVRKKSTGLSVPAQHQA